ncbi:beta strand repeat-containing protein [Actinokineospora cianjurensis]|uniref:Putative repeat protein (TIGR01451 family) n=1 Tax=Actinokineospora cianjurensis TaxID=585224 RepID=A0A421AVN2_9PSEU|nr:SdrD B-like domain-containing protein [Actinokineospora cianjurensis]RLK54139.1 putative repeat protein (TIGR01451 family) [Actinokineospora cianjurensis]
MSITRAVRRGLAAVLATVTAAAGVVVLGAAPVEAAVVRPFTLNYDKELYGDFVQAGNGTMQCPNGDDPEDPFGEPIATCTQSQARTNTTSTGINDSYYMRWADVDGSPATYNSSTGSVTIPAGAKIDYARLNWAGDTGTVRLADGTISSSPGCNTRQFLAGAGNAILPSGTPESTSARLTVGGVTTAYAPAVISRDALANVPNSQPQFYTAYANVTAQVAANLTTGSAQTLTVGNVWSPQGFGCFAGWSLVVVWYFDAPNGDAPAKREVYIYDGHVRQSSADAATTTTVSGFRVGDDNVRVGVTAYEGDFNISGDSFSINGTAVEEPISAAVTNNFFVSNAENDTNPAVANNMSVDSKVIATNLITTGSTSATLTFATSGDTYLAENLVLSVPIPSISVTKTLNAPGPYKPGDTVTYNFSIVSPGGSSATSVEVDDPLAANCDRVIGTLLADAPYTYSCTGLAGSDDYINTATATGDSAFGDPLTGTGEVPVTVINPSIDITKVADQATYTTGQTITFTITVHNDGDSPITGISVSDPTVPSCANATIGTLGAGGSSSYTCTATAPIAGDSNTATVNGTDQLGDPISDSATSSVPTVGEISGRVFIDRSNNGTYDPGATQYDTGVSGVTVTLTGTTAGGSPVNTPGTTASDGTFVFASVQAGTYTVTETQPAAYDDGTDTAGTHAVSGGNDIFTVTLTSGQSSTGNLFAELATSSLAGRVYLDADNSGTVNGAEGALTGNPAVTISLTGTDNGGNAVTLSTTTNGAGNYTFSALRPGTYTITETQPGGFTDGKETVGTSGGTLSPPNAISAISLAARANATGYLFGEYVATSITGSVVDDGGNAIANVTITLSGDASSSTTTAPNGTFSFTGLAPGTYTITETQPVAYGDGPESAGSPAGNISVNDVISGIVLSSGTAGAEYVFAEDRGSIAGVVFDDYDNDGIKDAGEPGLAASVTLTGVDANSVTITPVTITSNATTGVYTFPNLLGGTYVVTEATPGNRLDGKEVVGTTGGTLSPPNAITNITLAGGEDATGYTFGELTASSISGLVTDNAGAPDPLAANPLEGVTVTLTGQDDLGVNITPIVVVTAADGTYTFPGLRPGTYTITETQPNGYGSGSSTAGSEGGDDSLPNVIAEIVLDPNKSITDYNFVDALGSLTGHVFQDNNKNGIQNLPGDIGLPNVVLHLTGTDVNSQPVTLTATSKGDGSYLFPDLVAGTYSLTEEQPDTYNDGQDTPGTGGGSTSGSDTITPITITAGEVASGYNFAEYPDSIGGRVWVDLDGDGVIDVDETTFLANVTVTLQDGNGVQITTTTTDSNGHYSFPNLPLGNYIVVETQPVGYGSTTPNTVPVTLLQINPSTIEGKVVNFGERHGSIGDFVWSDTNGNGLQDSGEPGVAGVTLTLYSDTGTPITTTTTDGDGKYHFGDLVSGTYYVGVTLPAGKSFTKPNVEGDATNSDVSWVTGVSAALSVEPDGNGAIPQLTDVDAGLVTKVVDLAVGVTTPTPSANIGQTVIFTATVANTGTTPVQGARTTITIPAGLSVVSAGGTAVPAASSQDINAAAAIEWQCSTSGQTVTCATDAIILPGQSLGAITVNTTATRAVTDTTARATVTLADGSSDDNPNNDAAVVSVGVSASSSDLVDTGADVKWPFFGGLFLLLVGSVTVFITRRRRGSSSE